MKQKTFLKIVCLILIQFSGILSFAQTDPLFSQYMFNIQSFNPAYAGSWESLGVLAVTRQQWVGIEGAPQTYSLTGQSLLKDNRMGIGLSVSNDKLGKSNVLSFFGDYSYRVDIQKHIAIRLGLKAGVLYYRNNFSDYLYFDINDPEITYDWVKKVCPNFGVGAFLYSEVYYVGLSFPRILENNVDQSIEITNHFNLDLFYFNGGYIFDLHEAVKLKPSVILRHQKGLPAIMDMNVSALFFDKLWLGGMFRTSDINGFGLNVNFLINEKFRIGYAYDFMNTNKVSSFNAGTHEIILSYELKQQRTKIASPRFF